MSQAGSFRQGSGPFPPTVLETLTGDVGGAVPATLNNIDVLGGDNINTEGNPGISTLFINLNETIRWPETNAAGTVGAIYLQGSGGAGGVIFMHNYSAFGANAMCTFLGLNAGGNLTTVGPDNTGLGANCLQNLAGNPLFAGGNTAVGAGALALLETGGSNCALGNDCLAALIGGFNNVAAGDSALISLQAGDINDSSYNVAVGTEAARFLLTGRNNTMIGSGDGTVIFAAGEAYTSNESSNILINNPGVIGDNNTIRIGVDGNATGEIDQTFIAGIYGRMVGATNAPVIVDDVGQLGTAVSSKRFKKDIQPMREDDSEALMQLRPVSFRMINHASDAPKQFGLIAEEVEEILPYLVIRDADNQPFSVKYEQLPVFLLNELQKQHAIINSLVRRLNLLEQTVGMNYEL